MRFLMFEMDGDARLGALVGGDMVAELGASGSAPKTMHGVITRGPAVQHQLAALAQDPVTPRYPLSECRLLPPVPNPGKMVCLGLNYADHAKEGGHEVPDYPSLFMRASTSLIGPGDPMIVPRCSQQLDYEAELVIVVGKRCRYVAEEDALDVIFGYTLFNDGSVRDYQRKTAQWTAGKNFDGTGPLGPWIVTADELPSGAKGLGIRSRLNGQVMQESNTDRMLFDVPRTIAILTEIMTLEPGDLIATGTPEGVGHARRPPVWMRPGDVIEIEIDRIGTLKNPIAAAADQPA